MLCDLCEGEAKGEVVGEWKCASRNTGGPQAFKTYGGRSINVGKGSVECPGKDSSWAVGGRCWRAAVGRGRAEGAAQWDRHPLDGAPNRGGQEQSRGGSPRAVAGSLDCVGMTDSTADTPAKRGKDFEKETQCFILSGSTSDKVLKLLIRSYTN